MQGPFCQSCGMPITGEELFGTEKGGGISRDYCVYCYKEGAFTYPDVTLPQMVEICAPHLQKNGMREEQARDMLKGFLPTLKRWKGEPPLEAAPCYQMVQCEDIRLVGIGVRTRNADEMSGKGKLAALTERFYTQCLPLFTGQPIQQVFTVYTDFDSDDSGEYMCFIGAKVNEFGETPAGMSRRTIPAAQYALLATDKGPLKEVVIKAWLKIWQDCELAARRAFAADFEVYDLTAIGADEAQAEIYLSLKK